MIEITNKTRVIKMLTKKEIITRLKKEIIFTIIFNKLTDYEYSYLINMISNVSISTILAEIEEDIRI